MRRKTPPRTRLLKPEVVFQPHVSAGILQGVDQLVSAVRPTLGPLSRIVALEHNRRQDVPELLDDGALIARRVVQLAPRVVDVGGMLVRQALWKMSQDVGDGSVTMAVMYASILRQSIRYLTNSDGNAMLLRQGLERGMRAVVAALQRQAQPLKGRAAIAGITRSTCYADAEMAGALTEIFDMVGGDGLIVVEKGYSPALEWEYVAGTYWHLSGWFSRLLVTDVAERRTVFEDAALLISDVKIQHPDELVPVLQKCTASGIKRLVIIAADISDSALGLLVRNNQAKTIETLAVRTPRIAEMDRVESMEDIALLAGGRPFYAATETAFKGFRIEDLGHARRTWATESLFGLFGGRGDPRRVRQAVTQLKSRMAGLQTDQDRTNLQQRIGRLSGSTAVLRVGGYTPSELDFRKATAERAVAALRSALMCGVLPGGGSALLMARQALAEMPVQRDEDGMAIRILEHALEEPMWTIIENSGARPAYIIEKVKAQPNGFGYDVRRESIVDMCDAGILDSAGMLTKAIEVAVSSAALALTIDVMVLHKAPEMTFEP